MEASTAVSTHLQLGQLQLFHRHLTTPSELAIPLRFPPDVAVGFQDVGPDVQPIALEHILQEVRSGDGTQSYSVRTQGLPRDYRP